MDAEKSRQLDVSIELAQRNDVKIQCPRLLQKEGKESQILTGTELGCEGCRYQLNAPQFLNCAIIAGCHGPLRRIEIAQIMEVSEEQVRQIESSAMNVFKTAVMGEDGKYLKHEVETQRKLAERRKTNIAVDIDILEAIMEKYEADRKRTASRG